jgi:hypothetical protein
MKDCNGHREVGTACDVESQSVANAMKQLEILGTSIGNGNHRSLFFDFKRDLRHYFFFSSLLHNIYIFSLFLCTLNISAPTDLLIELLIELISFLITVFAAKNTLQINSIFETMH